ncbi:MAG: type IV pilus modification protein PilV [Rhodocyclaceae bacterium]|nr:type IV pilus modification protein PilV [Rhodocyclaceae bacterium]
MNKQRGVFLLEALIGIVIFSIGVLTMVALQAKSIEIQSDTQYRIEAANLADRMLGEITVAVDRSSAANLQASLANFAHRTTTNGQCDFGGTDSGDPLVVAWVNDITTNAAARLPGAAANRQQILVDTGTFNQVMITVCWQAAADAIPRRHTLVTYIN